MSNQSLFGSLLNAGQLLEVGMNELKILLPTTGKRAIGTRELNGCSCVLILGKTAIILLHVSPLPTNEQWDHSRTFNELSHGHHEKFLADIAEMLVEHANHFPPSSTAWGIFSRGRDSSGPVESIVDQVQTHLNAIGYTMRPAFYQVLDAQTIAPPKGEVVSFLDKDGIAELWLERTKLWPKQQQEAFPQVSFIFWCIATYALI
jgi:hypothetical protein